MSSGDPHSKRSSVDDLRDYYLGRSSPEFLEALKDPNSRASLLVEGVQEIGRRSRELDPGVIIEAVLRESVRSDDGHS
jgi:hypothetical protein